MDLAKAKCCAGNTCCKDDEPYDGSCSNLKLKTEISTYEDYVNNMKFLEAKKKENEESFRYYQHKEGESKKMLKNLFLGQFIDTEKNIKGFCVHETKGKINPYRHIYVYVIGLNQHDIGEDGLYVPVVQVRFTENNGQLNDVSINTENSHYISFETLCSCQITNKEFMEVYDRAQFVFMERLGLNKAPSNDNK